MNLDTIAIILFVVLVVSHWIAFSIGYDQAFKDYAGQKWEEAQRKVIEWEWNKRR